MGRAILSVIAGYFTMFVIVMVALTAAYLSMGSDKAFQPGVYDISTLWISVWAAVSIIAAIAGGLVAGKIARSMTPVWVLIGIVLVLGGLQAVGIILAPEPAAEELVRTGDVPNLEAMKKARQPVWIAVLNPIIGAAGVLVGARMARPGCPSARIRGDDNLPQTPVA